MSFTGKSNEDGDFRFYAGDDETTEYRKIYFYTGNSRGFLMKV